MTLSRLVGGLALRLTVADGRVTDAQAGAPRPLLAPTALRGRTVLEARRLVPLLFSLCASAQSEAFARAAADAAPNDPRDDAPDADADATRAALNRARLAELAQSHGWRFLIDGPRLTGATPDPRAVQTLRAAAADPDPARLAEALVALGFPAAAPQNLAELRAWSAETAATSPAGRLFTLLLADPDAARFGAVAIPPGPLDAPPGWFAAQWTAEPAFPARPRWNDGPAEIGPLARWRDHPLLRAVDAAYGLGLLARLTARLLDLLAVPAALAAPPPPWTRSGAAPGVGVGVVWCARGLLVHCLRLSDDGAHIADAAVIAPTEWSCAPDGPLLRGLIGAAAGPALAQRAELFAAAVDPCVPWSVRLDDAP